MQHIETRILDTSETGIVFSNIPQNFDDLIILTSLKDSRAGAVSATQLLLNNTLVTTLILLQGDGTNDSARGNNGYLGLHPANGATSTANAFGSQQFYIPNYKSSVNKIITVDSVTETMTNPAYSGLHGGLSTVTSPITTLEIRTSDLQFLPNSIVSLYGITAGSDGITTVS